MARRAGSTFETILPYFKEQNVGAYCWGFVAGKSQTIYPWDSWQKKYDAEPKPWFHDILRDNGKPYDEKEVKLIKKITGVGVELLLRFSVDVLDPLKPEKGFVECVIRNGSAHDVKVPTLYAGGFDADMILRGSAYGKSVDRWDLRLVFWAGPKKQETKLLKSGEEISIFKDDLTKVLLLDAVKQQPLKPGEPRYYWSWSA